MKIRAFVFLSFLSIICAAASAQTVVVPPPAPRFSVPPAPAISCKELFARVAVVAPAPVLAIAPAPIIRPQFSVARVAIEGPAGASTYVVNTGRELVRTNDVATVVATVRDMPPASQRYVDLTALTVKQRDTFVASARQHEAIAPLHYVNDIDPLVTETAKRTGFSVVDTGVRESGALAGKHYQKTSATIGGLRFSITVFSRVAEAVERFVARFRRYFDSAGTGESTFDVVIRLRREVAAEYGISESELMVQVRDQLGSAYFVDLLLEQTEYVR